MLYKESEDILLARKYTYFSEEKGIWLKTTLGSIMEDGLQQLKRYMNTIALGTPKSYYGSGVLDSRVNIDTGLDGLQGYVVMAIGGARVFVRSVDVVKTKYKYTRILQL